MEIKRGYLFPVLYICVQLLVSVRCEQEDEEEIRDDDDFGKAGMYHEPAWSRGGDDIKYTNEEEEIFYFFEDHDEDENMKIDGLELLHAMYHAEMGEIDDTTLSPEKREKAHRHTAKWRVKRMSALVDKALVYDLNDDGYFDWPEFKDAAKRLNLVNTPS